MSLKPSHLLVVFAVLSYLGVGCSNSPNEAANGAAGRGVDSSAGAAAGGANSLPGASGNSASGHGDSGNGSGGLPGTHTTGLVKLNLKVK